MDGEMGKNDQSYLNQLSEKAVSTCLVDASFYAKYDVKRGLRDVTGKGVLAGLTQIGDVMAHTPTEDGEDAGPGCLIYRGIDIREIVDGFMRDGRCGFEEITYLLLFGNLPDTDELTRFTEMLFGLRELPDEFVHDSILKLVSRDIMNAMSQSVLALYTLDDDAEKTDIPNVLRQCLRLIATFPLLAAYCYRAYAYRFQNKSLVLHSSSKTRSTAANFLSIMRRNGEYTPLEEQLLDLALVLHAEHGGGNNSAFTTHVVTSSGTDTYSTITAALGSLKGPRHGGANIKVVQMFEDMKRAVSDWTDEREVEDYLVKLVKKEAFDRKGLIYGIGHAVYSTSDPRSLILRGHVEKLAAEKGVSDEMNLYLLVERIGPDIIGQNRKMYKGVSANVDFYSGMLYRLLGIPPELYTPLFAISRIVGWSAHRIEELANSGKIIRPAYTSVAPRRNYTPIGDR
ncbi:MAG: citrate synthase [Kiritimatiellaeota bacterium]|nr:citrate synthase [Kiritimatiellota bacterium]